jgi:hypothetical protein
VRLVSDLFYVKEAIDPFGVRSWELCEHVQHTRMKACPYVKENLLGMSKSVGPLSLHERLEGLEQEIFV